MASSGAVAIRIEARQGEREAQTELQAGQDRLRHDPGKPRDPAGQAEQQQGRAQHDAARGQRGGAEPGREQHDRHRLHRLHRNRQAIVRGGGDIEDREAAEHRQRRKPGHGDAAQQQGQQGAEVA
jgi:hypothetical protein